jgi:hypothetical protein
MAIGLSSLLSQRACQADRHAAWSARTINGLPVFWEGKFVRGWFMNYPAWYIPEVGGGLLIAIIAITHVFISHFAVGGGLYLVFAERKGLRKEPGDPRFHLVHHLAGPSCRHLTPDPCRRLRLG